MSDKPIIAIEQYPDGSHEVSVTLGPRTERGWWGTTPEVALARMLIDQLQRMDNMARAMQDTATFTGVVLTELLNRLGEQLPDHEKLAYALSSTVQQAEVDRLRLRIWELEHQQRDSPQG